MTDLEKFKELFAKSTAPSEVIEEINDTGTIILIYKGYREFYTVYYFNKEGSLIDHGAYE